MTDDAFDDLLNLVSDIEREEVKAINDALSNASCCEKIEDLRVNIDDALEQAESLVIALKRAKRKAAK